MQRYKSLNTCCVNLLWGLYIYYTFYVRVIKLPFLGAKIALNQTRDAFLGPVGRERPGAGVFDNMQRHPIHCRLWKNWRRTRSEAIPLRQRSPKKEAWWCEVVVSKFHYHHHSHHHHSRGRRRRRRRRCCRAWWSYNLAHPSAKLTTTHHQPSDRSFPDY